MTAGTELSVRQAARRAGRSEETIRRWIWSGRLPALKRGTSYRIDVRHLEEIIVELDQGVTGHGTTAAGSFLEWLEEVAEWKNGLVVRSPQATAADLVIEDRHARR